jgi:hypothetical protein
VLCIITSKAQLQSNYPSLSIRSHLRRPLGIPSSPGSTGRGSNNKISRSTPAPGRISQEEQVSGTGRTFLQGYTLASIPEKFCFRLRHFIKLRWFLTPPFTASRFVSSEPIQEQTLFSCITEWITSDLQYKCSVCRASHFYKLLPVCKVLFRLTPLHVGY